MRTHTRSGRRFLISSVCTHGNRTWVLAGALFCIVGLGSPAAGAINRWIGGTADDDWHSPENWSAGQVPAIEPSTISLVDNGGTVHIRDPRVQASSTYLELGQNAGDSGAAQTESGAAGFRFGQLVVGAAGTGRFHHQSGAGTVSSSILLGNEPNGRGTFEMEAGTTLITSTISVGDRGQGLFIQHGGVITGKSGQSLLGVWLGAERGTDGTYRLEGGKLMSTATIGYSGRGLFVNTGGIHEGGVSLGYVQGSEGEYHLQGSGQLKSARTIIGLLGQGRFFHTSGTHSAGDVVLASASGGEGLYQLSGSGTLTAAGRLTVGQKGQGAFELSGEGAVSSVGLVVGDEGAGLFRQTGGSVTVAEERKYRRSLVLGLATGATGRYELSGGRLLVAADEYIGSSGTGTFVQTGGEHVTGEMHIQKGSYSIGGSGRLDVTELHLLKGTAFNQEGGHVLIRDWGDLASNYTLAGGVLEGSILSVGMNTSVTQPSTLKITSPDARIKSTTTLTIGLRGGLEAVPGATVELTGTAFHWMGTDPARLAGLGHLTVLAKGGPGKMTYLEAAGLRDGGFADNFALGRLIVGDETAVGRVALKDTVNNGRRAGGSEALFVRDLLINPGSSLDLNGLSLYVEGDVAGRLDGWIRDGRLFDAKLAQGLRLDAWFDAGRNWTTFAAVPEPATATFAALALLAARRRRRA